MENIYMQGKTLGIIGTGNVGGELARLGNAIGMRVLAWTFHPSDERARALGVTFVEIDELLRVRRELNGRFEDTKISVNDFVIRAAALALKQVPGANASFDPSGILLYEHADVSVAVATPGGLITPIVKAAETKGLATISAEMKNRAERAREGKLKPEEYQGGTFTVSNLGMFGVREFAAIINPPQGCILAVGAGQPRPVVKDGALAVATVMSCTLAVDHRVVDGALGAQFLAAFKKLIEYPPAMLL